MNPPKKGKMQFQKKVKYYVSHSYGKKIKEAPEGQENKVFLKIFVDTDFKYIYFEELQIHKLE